MSRESHSHQITTIDMLRHGECQGGEIYRGSTDVALTENGWRQMQMSVDTEISLAGDCPWHRIVSSPLQRCRRFAESTASTHKIPLAVDDAFREMHFGDWEGRLLEEVWRNDTDAVTQFYADPGECPPPNGETLQSVKQRLLPAWEKLLAAHRGEHLLVVQHGGTLRVLLSWLLQMPLEAITRLEIPYAGMARVKVFDDGKQQFPSLVFMNRTETMAGIDE